MDRDTNYPASNNYCKSILKSLLKRLNEQNLDPNGLLLARYAKLFTETAEHNGSTEHSVYEIPGYTEIVIKQDNSIISAAGTTGFRTWDAALRLADFLLANPLLIKGKNVIELGAGTGFISMLCDRLGANVLATDGDAQLVENIAQLAKLNMCNNLTTTELAWGPLEEALQGLDVILGADVTYDASSVADLVECIRHLLRENPLAKCYIAATVRHQKTLECLRKCCADDICIQVHNIQDISQTFYLLDVAPTINLFCLQTRQASLAECQHGGHSTAE